MWKKNTDSFIAALAGFFIIFLFTRHSGIGIEPDSVVYLTSAENLHSAGKMMDFMHNAVVEFPAFYPCFLSVIIFLTGQKPPVFAPVLNELLFATVIFLSGYIMERFSFRSKWYKRAILSCVVLSPCLLEVYSMMWSETLFILWVLLFMIAMHRYFQSYSYKTLILAAMIASIASVTRYAGVTIIATGGILLLLNMNQPLKLKWGRLFLYTVISSSLLLINLVRNYNIGSSLTGLRERSITSFNKNSQDVGSAFNDWLPFLQGHTTGAGWTTVLVIGGLLFICLKCVLYNRPRGTFENLAAYFSLVYILFMITIASVSRFETLNSRFLSPVFIPLLWSGSSWMVSLSQKNSSTKKIWITLLALFIFLSFQYNQLAADYETWDGVKDAGVPGYTEDQWTLSPTVLFIQKDSIPFVKGYSIYSNANDAVYFFTGRQGKFLPHKEYYPGIQDFLNDKHCYVVWFDDGDNPDLVDKDFITGIKKMKLLKQFNDGAIYVYEGQSN